jgi:Glycosyltransferase like family
VIVFGTAVTDPETYDRYAVPGVQRASEPDSVVLAHQTAGSLFRNYNLLLDMAVEHENLEALVLVHQDAEIADSDFAAKVRDALRDPDVAIVGCVGAVGVRSIAWWQGAVTWASVTHRYQEYGGGDTEAAGWDPRKVPSYAQPGEVDSIDGVVMVLSPWAVRELRFDESLGNLHGYDFDICMQARAAGKKVVTVDFRVIHHHSLELIKDPETWTLAYIRLVEKWNGQLPDTGADPEPHALRAEAEAACARGISVSNQLRNQAIRRQLARVERERDAIRRQLDVTIQKLEAALQERGRSAARPDTEASPAGGKFVAIDYAVERHGIESFASLEIAQAFGQYAFYTIGKAAVQRGTLIDVRAWRPRDQLLGAIEYAAEHPGMEVLDASFADPDTVTELGRVDAILLHDVLLRMVDPDWDQVLKLYAPATSSFVILNPQWERGETTIRLIDLGRESYLQAVPPWPSHIELFDHLDEWNEAQERPYRDGTEVWQWGITDADLKAKMAELGFSLEREWSLNAPPDTEGLLNKAFVFIRAEPSETADDNQASQ